jgi:VWFA-related protein
MNMRSLCFRFLFVLMVFAFIGPVFAQQKEPQKTPTPPTEEPQDDVKVTTEEVILSVTAIDSTGRRDLALTVEDLLVLEDGIPQQIKSLRYVPANVVLLLDTGGNLTWSKKVSITREAARNIVAALREGDHVAVIQVNNLVEVLQDWTANLNDVIKVLETKMISQKKTKLCQAMIAAAEMFKGSQQNRHLVLITDGIDTDGDMVQRAEAYKKLRESNVTVHTLSYTSIETVESIDRSRSVEFGKKKPPETLNDITIDELVPEELKKMRKDMRNAPNILTVDLDDERRKKIKAHGQALKRSELEMVRLTEDMGGKFFAPLSVVDFIMSGKNVAQIIDANYVVTYAPKRPIADAKATEVRRVQVVGRRVGLYVSSRRVIVLPLNSE